MVNCYISRNVVSNVTLQVKLDGILICGDENIKELKELLFKERSGLTSRLFHGDLAEYRHPVASVERHQMEKQVLTPVVKTCTFL